MRKLLVFSWNGFLDWMCCHVTYTKQIFRLFHCSDVQNAGHESSSMLHLLVRYLLLNFWCFLNNFFRSAYICHAYEIQIEQQHLGCSESLFLLDVGYWSPAHCWCCLHGWAFAFWNSKSLSKLCLFPVFLLKAFSQQQCNHHSEVPCIPHNWCSS